MNNVMSLAIAKKPSPDHHNKKKHDAVHNALKSSHTVYPNPQVPIIQLKPFCPCDGGCPRCTLVVQPKLIVGQPNDIYEQEADRVAEQVMRMMEPEEPWKDKPEIAGSATSVLDEFLKNLDPGQPLDPAIRAFFEPRFGYDFSHVRVHTDNAAAQSAEAVGASAYTVGRHVVFGEGKYNPATERGHWLIAHELAHVGQQGKFNEERYSVIRRVEDQENSGDVINTDAITAEASRHLERFTARIIDMGDFNQVAYSYGMEHYQLLAKFYREGGLEDYETPILKIPPCELNARSLAVRLQRPALLSSYFLWAYHGLDDFAPTCRPPGASDNRFDWQRTGNGYILSGLRELYAKGLLWDKDTKVRTTELSSQCSPEDILEELEQAVNVSTQLPMAEFVPLAYRLQAAQLASRQHLIGHSIEELRWLGYSEEISERFGYGAIDRVRIGVAVENKLIPREDRYRGYEGKLKWVEENQWNPEYLEYLFKDETYRGLVSESFEGRLQLEVARLSMGTPRAFREAIEGAYNDYEKWEEERLGREAIENWARSIREEMNRLIQIIDESVVEEIHRKICNSINEENIPKERVRLEVKRRITDWLERNDYEKIREMLDFIYDAYGKYQDVDTVQKWIVALGEVIFETSMIEIPAEVPRELKRYLMPSASAWGEGRIRDVVLRNVIRDQRLANEMIRLST